MTKNKFLKSITIVSSVLLLTAYVAYRSNIFESKDKEQQIEIDTDEIKITVKKDSLPNGGYEVAPDSLQETFRHMSSSKVGLVLQREDLINSGRSETRESLIIQIENLTSERERLIQSAKPNNPIIVNLDYHIKSLKNSLKKIDSIKTGDDDK